MTTKQKDYILGLDEVLNSYLFDDEKPHSSYDILGEGWEDVYEQLSNELASTCIKKLKELEKDIVYDFWGDIPFGVDYEGDAIF